MHIYKHRQPGTLLLCALGFGAASCALVLVLSPNGPVVVGVVLVVLVLCMVLFHSLAVEVTANEVVASFGPGVIRKRIQVADIRGARVVRNPWYYGWGIRLTPRGWLFNVSGLDAVEVDMKNGRKFRIGTDDPQHLLTAIRRAAGLAP